MYKYSKDNLKGFYTIYIFVFLLWWTNVYFKTCNGNVPSPTLCRRFFCVKLIENYGMNANLGLIH